MAVSRIWGTANQTKLTHPNGWVEEYSYDGEAGLAANTTYTYDGRGNLIKSSMRS